MYRRSLGRTALLYAVGSLFIINSFANAVVPTFTQHTVDANLIGAWYTVAADIDSDGDQDLIAAGQSESKIVWYENDGSENFAAEAVIVSSFSGAVCVAVVDLDFDGDMDVVGVASTDDDVVWYENDGSESFTPHDIDANYNGAYFVSVADMDADGDMDIVTVGYDAGEVTLWANDGTPSDGGWTETTVASGLSQPTQAIPMDMDSDGDMDIVASIRGDDAIVWYENNAGWTARSVDAAVDGASSIAVVDLDFDGDQDIVGCGELEDAVYWWENDGTPADGGWTEHLIDDTIDGPVSIAIKDLDVDADPDIVVSAKDGAAVYWYANDGTPQVGDWTRRTVVSSFTSSRGVTIADVDQDGMQDILASSGGLNDAAWFESDISEPEIPTFVSDTLYLAYDGAQDVKIVDLDSDGDMDFLSVGYTGDDLSWWENDGEENFTQIVISATINTPNSVDFADMDNDGDIDVVTTTYISDEVSWWENDGTPDAGWTENNISSTVNGASCAQPIDLDRDGDMDVIAAAYSDDDILFFENDGSQNFTLRTVEGAYNGARHLVAADMDNDGDIDIVAAGALEDDVTWFENDGDPSDGGWIERTIDANLNEANAVHVIDVDRDGDIDVVATAGSADVVRWYANDGSPADGGWTSNLVQGSWGGGSDVMALDVDGDGDIDLAATAYDDDALSWWENNGSQNFTERSISTSVNGAQAFWAGDVDSDGDIDFVTCAYLGDELLWWNNQQIGPIPPSWSSTVLESNFNGASSISLGDFDGDGLPDIVGTAQTDNDLHWWSNDGDGTFTQSAIENNYPGVVATHAEDIDGDGDYDLAGVALDDDDVDWFENDGTGSFTYRDIDSNFPGAFDVFAADVTGDGYCDVVAASITGDEINLYENDGTPADGGWTEISVATNFDSANFVTVIDLDSDGDLDILATAAGDDEVAWFENDGSQNFTKRTIDSTFDGAISACACDVDGDGDVDVTAAASYDNEITWWENDGSPADGGWTAHLVESDFLGASSVYVGDIDKDGDADICATGEVGDYIAWWENDGSQNFSMSFISGGYNGAHFIIGGDIDLDGDTDLMTTSHIDGKLTIWENATNPIAAPSVSKYAIGRRVWTMIGVPVKVSDGNPDTLFRDDLNNTSPATGQEYWTLSRYSAPDEIYVRYHEDGPGEGVGVDPPDMTPGLGYWMIQDVVNGCNLDITAAQTVGVVDQSTRHRVKLDSASTTGAGYRGANQLANPFRYAYDWRQTYVYDKTNKKRLSIFNAADSGWISGYAYLWDHTSQEYININFDPDSTSSFKINPWRGFWVEQLVSDRVLHIEFTPEAMFNSLASLSELKPSEDSFETANICGNWSLTLQVMTDDSSHTDSQNRIGCLSRARDGYDLYDALDFTPQASQFAQLYFPHDDWDMQSTRFSYDFRVLDAEDSSEVWDCTIRQWQLPNTDLTLTWPDIQKLPPEVTFHLLDYETNEVLADMRLTDNYAYTTGEDSYEEKSFKIRAVWYPSAVDDDRRNLPTELSLKRAYPNPFNSKLSIEFALPSARSVSLSVYDLQGRLVDEVVADKFVAGVHAVSWDAVNFASGSYFIELKAGADVARQQVHLTK